MKKKKGTASKRTTDKKRGQKAKNSPVTRSEGVAAEVRSRAAGRSVRLADLETELDRLLFSVMSLGNLPEVEKALRQTRRALYSAFRCRALRS